VRPKVDQTAGLLRLPHLGISAVLQRSQHLPLPRKHSPEGDTAAQQCRTSTITTHLPTLKGWKAELV